MWLKTRNNVFAAMSAADPANTITSAAVLKGNSTGSPNIVIDRNATDVPIDITIHFMSILLAVARPNGTR